MSDGSRNPPARHPADRRVGVPSSVRRRPPAAVRAIIAAVTGIGVVATLGAAVAFAGPWAAGLPGTPADGAVVSTTSQPVEVPVDPVPTTLVCPSPAQPQSQSVGDEQFASTALAASAFFVWADAPDATLTPIGGISAPMRIGSEVSFEAGLAEGALVLTAPAGAPAAGVTGSVTAEGDLRGLATAACGPAAISQWLVGGSTAIGATATLRVDNPSDRPATVFLTVYGTSGEVVIGSRGIFLVGPGSSVDTPLEAIAPGERGIAVHVQSTGAPVAASMACCPKAPNSSPPCPNPPPASLSRD